MPSLYTYCWGRTFEKFGQIPCKVGLGLLAVALMAGVTKAEDIPKRTEGEGPYKRLILRNVIYVDGTGSPAQGPVDIVIVGDRIAEIHGSGDTTGIIDLKSKAAPGDKEFDLTGYYVLPGFVDCHTHLPNMDDPQHVPSDYVLKLWISSGVTSVRELGSLRPIEWLKSIKERSAKNEIVAPRIDVYPFFQSIEKTPPNTPDEARAAVRDAKRRGADGIKFINFVPQDVLWAALDEAKKQELHTTMHHSQQSVAWANVINTSAHGMDSMEHWYGLPEAMFTDGPIQKWPTDYVNDNEEMRFAESGRLWTETAAPDSAKWNEVMDTLLKRDFVIDPTFTAYLAGRDFMRMSRATWHADYTLPSLWHFYKPSRSHHASFWYDWTLEDEVSWRENYKIWMQFINEYKNRGGKVSVGSDSGYLYNLYGYGYIQELTLLREAGFSPLEVIHAATQVGAEALGHENEVGTIRVGRKADLVVVEGNPLANLNILFGTGTIRLDEKSGKTQRVGGIRYTIKDGIVYDDRQLRAEIRAMVAKEKAIRGIPQGIMSVEDVDLTK